MPGIIALGAALLTPIFANESPDVVNTTHHLLDDSEYVVHRGEIELEAEGLWEAFGITANEDPRQLYLIPPDTEEILMPGLRMRAVQRDRNIQHGRHILQSMHWPCREYAAAHGSVGPSTVEDLDHEKYGYLSNMISTSPWGDHMGKKVEGPFVYLLPEVRFDFEEDGQLLLPQNRRVLAVELRPFVNDGEHYVLYTDGSCNRESIDEALVEKHALEIRPLIEEHRDPQAPPPETLTYTLVAVRDKEASGSFVVPLRNVLTNASLSVDWDPSSAGPDEEGVLEDLARARLGLLRPYVESCRSPMLMAWLQQYRDRGEAIQTRREEQSLSAFSVLGGRAAVRETLQMQVLNVSGDQDQDRTIAVNSLEGVQVQSHPYEEMLGAASGGSLALAEIAPKDHFFLYVAKPPAIVPFLDKGAPFLSHFGAAVTGNSIRYHLRDKMLSRLGLNAQWVRTFLQAGVVKECALVVPDLFFIDGTDVTAICRLAQPGMLETMLELVGVSGLSTGSIVERVLVKGRVAYFALEDDLLFISTNRTELEGILKLNRNGGTGSLGHTAEFRYMLTQLPLQDDTRMYAYFSDPFIRRLVGPRTKIAQLRRMRARADMEFLTSCAVIAGVDGRRNPESLERLAEQGYVPEHCLSSEYSLGDDAVIHSRTYGTLADLKTLSEVAIDKVSAMEAQAYDSYVKNYTQFWRRFFDPIAVRLDDTPQGALEATTFILPLIDNTFYNALGEWLHRQEDGVPLRVPVLSDDPILMLSLNLKDDGWRSILEGSSNLFEDYAHLSPAIMDDLGPGIHLAIHDADPVVALGSGDLLGPLNVGWLRGGRNEMMMLPFALSVLTRPCTLLLETQDPGRTRRFLRQAAYSGFPRRSRFSDEFSVAFHQVEGRDAWVCTLDIMGFMKLRYGLEVQGDYLLIRNIPWSNESSITRIETTRLNAASLQAFPEACRLQLPGLHATASDAYLSAALQGMGHLYPLLAAGYATPENVEQEHFRLFGFNPAHPGEGTWMWDGMKLFSSKYGSVYRPRQPAYEDGDREFGILKDLEYLKVTMQFEDTGLRTTARWKLRR